MSTLMQKVAKLSILRGAARKKGVIGKLSAMDADRAKVIRAAQGGTDAVLARGTKAVDKINKGQRRYLGKVDKALVSTAKKAAVPAIIGAAVGVNHMRKRGLKKTAGLAEDRRKRKMASTNAYHAVPRTADVRKASVPNKILAFKAAKEKANKAYTKSVNKATFKGYADAKSSMRDSMRDPTISRAAAVSKARDVHSTRLSDVNAAPKKRAARAEAKYAYKVERAAGKILKRTAGVAAVGTVAYGATKLVNKIRNRDK